MLWGGIKRILCAETRTRLMGLSALVVLALLPSQEFYAEMVPLQEELYFIYPDADGVLFKVSGYTISTGEWRLVFNTEPYTQVSDWWVHASGVYYSTPQEIQRVSLYGGEPEIILRANDGIGGTAISGLSGFAYLGDILYVGTVSGTGNERTFAINRFSKNVLYSVEGVVSGSELHLAPDNTFLYGDPSMSLRIPLDTGVPLALLYDPLSNGSFAGQNQFVKFNLNAGLVAFSSGSILTYPDFEYAGSMAGTVTAGSFHGDNFVALVFPETQGPDETDPEIRVYDRSGQLLGLKQVSVQGNLFEIYIHEDTLFLFYREHFQSEWPPYQIHQEDLSEIYSSTAPAETFRCDPLDLKGSITDHAVFPNGDFLFRAYGDTYQGEKHSLFRYSHSSRVVTEVFPVTRNGHLVAVDQMDSVYIGEPDGTIWKIPAGEDLPIYFATASGELRDMMVVHGDILVVNSGNDVCTYGTTAQMLDRKSVLLWSGFAAVNPSAGRILTANGDHGRIFIDQAGLISTASTARSSLGAIDPSLRYTTSIESGELRTYDIDTNESLAATAFPEYRNLRVLDWNTDGILTSANDPSDPLHPDPDSYVLLLDATTLEVILERALLPEYKSFFISWGKVYPIGETYISWVEKPGPGYGKRIVPVTLDEMLGEPVTSLDAFGGWIRSAQWTWGPEYGFVRRDLAPWYYQADFGYLWLGPWNLDGAWFYSRNQQNWIYSPSRCFPAYYSPERNAWCYKVLITEYGDWLFDLTMNYWARPKDGSAPPFMDGRWMVVDPDEVYGPSQLLWFHNLYFSFDTAVSDLYDYLPMGFPYAYTRLGPAAGFVDWMDGGFIQDVNIKGDFTVHFESEWEGTLDSNIVVSSPLPNSPFYEEGAILRFIIVPAGSWTR